jgi:hypothetical protein
MSNKSQIPNKAFKFTFAITCTVCNKNCIETVFGDINDSEEGPFCSHELFENMAEYVSHMMVDNYICFFCKRTMGDIDFIDLSKKSKVF